MTVLVAKLALWLCMDSPWGACVDKAGCFGGGVTCASCITIPFMSTLTIRTDPEVEQALDALTSEGRSRSEAARVAILDAERARRRAQLRAEAEELRNDPDDVAASQELAAEMEAIRAR